MTPSDPFAGQDTGIGRNLTYGMVDQLGRAIVTGAYDHHPFPTEAELAAQFNVSRSVVREAVKMLTAKGLLSARPRQGTVVQPSSSWNLFGPDVLSWLLERQFSLPLLRQFTELRLGVEPTAAALAAQRAEPEQRAAIEAAYHRMELAERGEDDPLSADIAFHIAILRAAGNPFFLQLRDVVETALRSSIRFTNRFKGHTANLAEHHRVLAAIEARDPVQAQAAMTHLINAVITLITDATIPQTNNHPP